MAGLASTKRRHRSRRDADGKTPVAVRLAASDGGPVASRRIDPDPTIARRSVPTAGRMAGRPAGSSGAITFLDDGIPVDTTILKERAEIFTTSRLHAGNNVFAVSHGGDTNDQPANATTGVDVVLVTRKGHGDAEGTSRPEPAPRIGPAGTPAESEMSDRPRRGAISAISRTVRKPRAGSCRVGGFSACGGRCGDGNWRSLEDPPGDELT